MRAVKKSLTLAQLTSLKVAIGRHFVISTNNHTYFALMFSMVLAFRPLVNKVKHLNYIWAFFLTLSANLCCPQIPWVL